MPNLNYDTIARILSKSEPQTWRITDNGGMVVISADGKRLSFTPAEVNEADLPRVYLPVSPTTPLDDMADMAVNSLPIIEPRPIPDVIIAPKPPVILTSCEKIPLEPTKECKIKEIDQRKRP